MASACPPLLGPLLLACTTSGVRESDVRQVSADSAIIPPGGICHTLDRAKWVRALSLLVLPAMLLTGCSKEPEYTDQQRVCIARLYSSYDAKQMNQCVNVCKSCMGGSTVTCTTSCNLKGAQ
jgi:hypothetical protein